MNNFDDLLESIVFIFLFSLITVVVVGVVALISPVLFGALLILGSLATISGVLSFVVAVVMMVVYFVALLFKR